MTTSPSGVRDNVDARQFEVDAGGALAVAQYRVDAETITFTHTFVPEPARGQGVATMLIEAALEAARAQRWQVVPQCEAFATYMQEHPETQDLLAAPSLPSVPT